jgi:hypothetical protein
LIGLNVKRLAIALAFVLASCGSSGSPSRPAPSRDLGTGPTVFALLADRRLLAVSPVTAAVGGELRLPGAGADASAHVVAIDPARRLLRVLLPGSEDRGTVATVDARTLAVRATWTLPVGIRHRTLVVGPVSGDVFAFGDRDEDGGQSPWLTRISADGTARGSWRLRPSSAHNWAPYAAAVAADERYAVVSYHGSDTTGADIVRLDGQVPQGCAASTVANAGCIAEIHGAVSANAGRVLGTTGDGTVLVSVDPFGRQPRRLNPGLPGNHLMEFAVDPAGPVYAVGSCLYSGGLSRLDAGAVDALVLAVPMPAPQRPDLCGERIAVGPAGLVAITWRRSIVFVDGATGHVRATVPAPVAPVDIVVG